MAFFFALLFWLRARREERISDSLMGWLMFILALQLQDYTFGFAGINFLWEELNGFPRGVYLLIGPIIYFYLKSQSKPNFRFHTKDLIHLLPHLFFTCIGLIVFFQGASAVQQFQSDPYNPYFGYFNTLVRWASYLFYFSRCFQIYNTYQVWVLKVYSDPSSIDLKWFKLFIQIMLFGMVFKEVMMVLDHFLYLSFYQDWWWNLALVLIVILTGIRAYAQPAILLAFDEELEERKINVEDPIAGQNQSLQLKALYNHIVEKMEVDKMYLQAGLSLKQLSDQMNISQLEISNAIQQSPFDNFNDFINSFRVEEFKKRVADTRYGNFTLLAIGLESGFNSKATFNRVFAKREGMSPKEYLASQNAKNEME